MSAVFVHFLPSEEWIHRVLAVIVAGLGGIALIRGIRIHRQMQVLYLMMAGLSCIFLAAFAGDRMPGHWMEVAVTMTGSVLMISAHRRNHTFCRDCSCAD